jgi:quinol monooxygenase YgiN
MADGWDVRLQIFIILDIKIEKGEIMIVLHATINIKPGKRDQAIPVFLEMEQATHQEPGCIEYTFVSTLGNPDIFMAVERWQDQTALDGHNKSAHMAAFRKQLPELVEGPSALKLYDATPL